jgi:hypothetical protein
MIDGLRSEFPDAAAWITRLRRPTVAREPLGWALLSAAGAGFIVGGIVGLVLFAGAPVLFSSTEPRPTWLTYPVITQAAASIAIGAVALRSGGPAALALTVLYQLALILAAFPGRQNICTQFGGQDPSRPLSCDIPAVIADRWPMWLALAVGAVGSRWLLRTGEHGANRLLRGAGVFAVVLTLATTLYGVLTYATLSFRQSAFDFTFTGIYVLGQLVGGILAGFVLMRAPVAASVLVAALILSSLSFSLPLGIRNTGPPNLPLELLFLQWATVLASVLGAASVVLVRLLASRGKESGTIS